MSDSITMLTVSSVPATSVEKGFVQITAGTRTSEKNPTIPENMRSRSIIIPELSVSDGVSSKFQKLVIAKLYDLAQNQLKALWKETPMLREVPAAIWSVDALLTYFAREAESTRLTKDSIAAWLKGSKLGELLSTKPEAVQRKWTAAINGLAAPVLQLSEDECNLMLATLGKFDEDQDHLICQQLVSRVANRLETLRKQSAEVSSLEAL